MASGSTGKGKAPASAGDNPTPEPEPAAAEAATPEPASDGKRGQPEPTGEPKGHREPAGSGATEDDDRSVEVSVVWAAVARGIRGTWSFEGVTFHIPPVQRWLDRLDPDGDKNVVIFPLPRPLVEAVIATGVTAGIKIVSGKRLPKLHLYDAANAGSVFDRSRLVGANSVVWGDYKAEHQPKAVALDRADWAKDIEF